MYKLTYSVTTNSRCLFQVLFVNEKMVVTSVDGKWNVFRKKQNKNYVLDFDNKKISPVDYSDLKNQIKSISKNIEIIKTSIKNSENFILGYPSKGYEYVSKGNFPHLNSQISIGTISNFDKTSYSAYFNFEKQNQLLDILLGENDLLMCNTTRLTFPQGNLTQQIELISIEEWSFTQEFLEIDNYKTVD
ncbi:hypothetical protein [Flavobacterium humidisoli]|uniref:Uncharacterized protein n=1 Tax=Flavobacterium humidisoli TaxID=2937442 RepID=A0ABY4LZM6_9FLAO|nr:hypothetical protein [Flavobacterium humidisoli]UPZ18003.1 hypothetical protein M0M44_11790 [Flavobacterium humidisoli]